MVVVAVVAIAMAMPKLISWRSVKSGVIDGVGVDEQGIRSKG